MGTSFGTQVQQIPTDQLVQAYSGYRNPFNLANKIAPEGQAAMQAELKRRGIDTSGIQVTPGGEVHHNVGFSSWGKPIGRFLKVAAPIAALAIPGLGPLAAAGIAAAGSEAGNVLQGKNALKSLPGSLGTGAAVGGGKLALRSVGNLGGGAPGSSGGLAAIGNAGSGGGGFGGALQGIGQSLGLIRPDGSFDAMRAAQLGLGVTGIIQGAQAQNRSNQQLNRALSYNPTAGVNPNATTNLAPVFGSEAAANPYWKRVG